MYPGNIMEYAGQYNQEEFNKVIREHLSSLLQLLTSHIYSLIDFNTFKLIPYSKFISLFYTHPLLTIGRPSSMKESLME